jgi:hypothetical protein
LYDEVINLSFRMFIAAFPDLKFVNEFRIAECDLVMSIGTMEITHLVHRSSGRQGSYEKNILRPGSSKLALTANAFGISVILFCYNIVSKETFLCQP